MDNLMNKLKAVMETTVGGTTEVLEVLHEYCESNNIDTDKPVYTLCVEDVLVTLADSIRYTNSLVKGELQVEDAIDVVENKLEIDWQEYIRATIDARLLQEV